MPAVSIILPFFNRAHTLHRCLTSIQAQTFQDWELIAVDDASTDGSAAVLTEACDARIRLIRHERNRGPGAARNTALAAAKGDFIALIDSDDEWMPGKLQAQIGKLRAGECDLCGCEYLLVDEKGERRVSLPPPPSSWREVLHTRCELGNGTTLVVARRVVDEIGGFDEALRLYEDWDWVLRMVQRFRYDVVREPLARIHFSGLRSARNFADGAEHFLRKHDAELATGGEEYRRRLRAKHFEFVAASAFENREYLLGCRYLLRSFAECPRQNPARLGALLLAPIDAAFGTSLIQRAAAMVGGR